MSATVLALTNTDDLEPANQVRFYDHEREMAKRITFVLFERILQAISIVSRV